MDKRILVAIPVLIALVAAGMFIAGESYRMEESYVLEGTVNGSGGDLTVGLAADERPIGFGTLPGGAMSSERQLELENPGDGPVEMRFSVEGNISKYISIDPDESVRIESGGARNISLVFEPENASQGYYRGDLFIERHGLT
ncbi:MAG: hypothetical protein MUP63_00860 [Candidatus Nanohaloarchaeota archaeon QJJ-7]|nr:hypothetical protein [Candidatus Nanohaloarchaeota archaeon QJJ-7]